MTCHLVATGLDLSFVTDVNMQGPALLILLSLSIAFIVIMTSKVKLHPFLVLLLAAIGVGIFAGLPLPELLIALRAGFGNTLGSIGIVIFAGTIIGIMLEKTGASMSMANAILKVIGRERSPLAISVTAYIVGIPIFCDSGFVVLSPLNNALAKMSKISMTVMAFALAGPLYIIHCLIPPHPGPTAAAGMMGADMGLLILLGTIAGIPAVLAGLLWALKFAGRYWAEPPGEKSFEQIAGDFRTLPHPALAFTPIALPVILIGLGSFAKLETQPFGYGKAVEWLTFLGDPAIALLVGVFAAMILIKKSAFKNLGDWTGDAIRSAGPIIAITGAGGAFGYILRITPIGDYLGTALLGWNLGLFLPFVLAAALKTAQGSSTVAVITASSLMMPLLPQLGFDHSMGYVFTILAMGAGSMLVSHPNDSYFWVVTKFANLDINQALKTFTPGTIIIGCISMITIYLLSLIVGI